MRNQHPFRQYQRMRSDRYKALTARAHDGDREAFAERYQMESRDPMDMGIAWQQFQKDTGQIPQEEKGSGLSLEDIAGLVKGI